MSAILLHGRPAVKVNAKKVMWGVTPKANLYNINGEEKWVPNTLSKYNDKKEVLTIEEWFYNRMT